MIVGIAAGLPACAKDPAARSPADAGPLGGDGSTSLPPATIEGTITLSAASSFTAPATALGLNYWSWTYGATLQGTEPAVTALGPNVLRIGGHNNDWNLPTPFDETEIERALDYARTVGAAPVLQVPILDDVSGTTPSAETAAAMVRFANVTKARGVKYFSIGNEPDLYADPTQTPVRPGFSAADYCAAVKSFVPAMRAEDPSIQILGPELSWKYQSGANDWLTPILSECGDLLDVITIHRYPIDPARTLRPAAAADAELFRATIDSVRKKMVATGQGQKPLGVTETNLTWNGDPATSTLEASPGTLPAGLWAADTLGVGLTSGLWTTAFWSIREGWTLGLLSPDDVERPAYHAVSLYRDHFGPSVWQVTAAPAGIHAYASRNAAGNRTELVVVNWTEHPHRLSIAMAGQQAAAATDATVFTVPALAMTAVVVPDSHPDAPTTWTYGAGEWQARLPPQPSP